MTAKIKTLNFIHQILSTWFGFNRQQRNGLVVLCCFILILFSIRLSLRYFVQKQSFLIADFSDTELPEAKQSINIQYDSAANQKNEILFVFDPNKVNQEQLMKLGFNEKTAVTFIKFRNKGAIFRNKDDLKKVYGVTETLYLKLEPYILIEKKQEIKNAETKHLQNASAKISTVELNTIDSAGLLPLPGIGSGFAKKIIKYRGLLGGYYKTEQLKEVYGFSDSLYRIIKSYVKADPSLVTKIDLNTEDFKKLNSHPYISYEETKALFNYRRKNGHITTKEQLKEILGELTFIKIEPYVNLN